MKKEDARSRGRPRAFDKDEAITAAIDVFWSQGYANASLDDLTAAMKISRPSLYAAFGDKEGLYLACLKAHGDRVVVRMQKVTETLSSGVDITRTIYHGAIDIYTQKSPVPRGCLFAAASLSDVTLSEELRAAVAQQLDRLVQHAESIFKVYPAAGLNAAQASKMFSTCLFGFATRARLGELADDLKADADGVVAWLYPPEKIS